MFIPRGTALYENLATSYVLVDSLIADLCEGGFSGMVEVTLRRADAHIVMVRGRIGIVVLARGGESADAITPTSYNYSRTTVSEIAAAARLERGRVSIYRYPADIAETIAGPAAAEALYTQLSTEFADLEKVVLKLRREADRQWFVEVTTTSGLCALVHMRPDRCLVLTARDGLLREPCESSEPMTNRDLHSLLDEARLMGGTFDVSFRGVDQPLTIAAHELEPADEEPTGAAAPANVADAVKEAKAVFDSLSLDETWSKAPGAIPAAGVDRIPEKPETGVVRAADESTAETPAAPGETEDAVPRGQTHDEPQAAAVPAGTPPREVPEAVPLLSEVAIATARTSSGSSVSDSRPASGAESPVPLMVTNPPPVLPVEPTGSAEAALDDSPMPVNLVPAALDEAGVHAEDEPIAVNETLTPADSGTTGETSGDSAPHSIGNDPQAPVTEAGRAPAGKYARRLLTDDLLMVPDDLRATGLLKRGSQADVLAEIKRLMSEMLRTVEESIRAAGERESFAMRLRAGQLTVAERFPFLDPFGGEFEYLAGEIVFVGETSADDFIYGLGEALAQAIDVAARASAQPARVRSHVDEGLRWLLGRQRAELEAYNLDQCIDAILADIQSRGEPALG